MEIRVRQSSTTMKRTVNVLSKLNWGKRACAVLALCATTAVALPAQTLTTLYSFCSQSRCPDGSEPRAGLVQATNGDLYGTTTAGGIKGNGGTVFRITPGGTLATLYRFCAQANCTDGTVPQAGLVQAANGDFYGTTSFGGANEHGTIFKITQGGAVTTLYSFCSQTKCTDGAGPQAGLVQAANGDLYGTTNTAGANGGPNERKLPGRSGKPQHQQRIPKQNHSTIDLRLSHQLLRRRCRRPGCRQPVPQFRLGVDAGRCQRQRRRRPAPDHGRRHQQHIPDPRPLEDPGLAVLFRHLHRRPQRVEQRVPDGYHRTRPPGAGHRPQYRR